MSKKSNELMKKLTEVFFPVKKLPAEEFYKTKNVVYLPGLDHVIVVTKPDGGQVVVNSCSSTYELVSNRELLEPFIERLSKEHEDLQITRATAYQHSKFHVDFVVEEDAYNMSTGKKRGPAVVDSVVPLIRYNNSYDGSLKYSYEAGFYRYICSNGAKVPDGVIAKDIIMHTPGAATRVQQSVDNMEKFLSQAASAIKGYDPLMELNMSKADAKKRIEEVVEDLDYPKKNMQTALDRLDKEVGMGLPINDWLVYNALNYGLYQTAESMILTNKADKIDHQVLNYLLTQ